MLPLYWTFSCISVQQPSSFTFVFGITIMFRSIDVLLSISLFACPTNTLSQLHVNMRERQTYNTFISQHFHFFGSCAFNCVLKARMGGAHTFHRLHEDLLLLTGVLFIQQHTVEDAAKCACQRQMPGFYLRKRAGETQPEASQAKAQMSPHSQPTMPGWSVDRDGQASA